MIFDKEWRARRVQRATDKIPRLMALGERRYVRRKALYMACFMTVWNLLFQWFLRDEFPSHTPLRIALNVGFMFLLMLAAGVMVARITWRTLVARQD